MNVAAPTSSAADARTRPACRCAGWKSSNATATTRAPEAKASAPAVNCLGGVRKQPSTAPTTRAPHVTAT